MGHRKRVARLAVIICAASVSGNTAVNGAFQGEEDPYSSASAFLFGGSSDCNGNGIPDECDIDCGEPNGPCDLPGCGESADCNDNSIPDECDIADCDGSPWCGDCNGNGVPDECDLESQGGSVVLYSFDLDEDPGWETEGLWAWGQPTGEGGSHGEPDPTGGYTGTNVYGYNLEGDYENDLPETHLTSGPIDCTGFQDVRLSFRRWLGVEDYDHAYVRVSADGTNWVAVWQSFNTIEDDDWIYQEFDISGVADGQPTLYLRWTMGPTDYEWQYCGWNIDDVEIHGDAEPVSEDCNGNEIPDECDIGSGFSDDCQPNGIPDECEMGKHDCCETGHGAGCSDPDIEACVCAIDPYCCDHYWDQDCADAVITEGCGTCEGTGDCNGNDVLDECDIADCDGSPWCGDCNGNSVPDECDIADCDGSPWCDDCNDNGVPDGCEDDCNGNEIADACDIADCDGSPWCDDCDGNGVPDGCDLMDGHDCCEFPHEPGCSHPLIRDCVCAVDPYCCEVEWDRLCVYEAGEYGCVDCDFDNDCNENGVLDSCDVAEGTSLDCNANNIPDECEYPGCPGILPGDMNCDGLVDGGDIQSFVNYFVADRYTCQADMNQDGIVDAADVSEFATTLLGGTFLAGDLNCDDVQDGLDIGPFVLALTDEGAYSDAYPGCKRTRADCNDDGQIDVLDVERFVTLLIDE